MSDAPLLPCPFCGFDGCYVRSTGIETEVYCQNCTAVGPMYVSDTFNDGADDAKAIAAWNTRTDTATWNAAIRAAANIADGYGSEACNPDMHRAILALLKEEPK